MVNLYERVDDTVFDATVLQPAAALRCSFTTLPRFASTARPEKVTEEPCASVVRAAEIVTDTAAFAGGPTSTSPVRTRSMDSSRLMRGPSPTAPLTVSGTAVRAGVPLAR